MAVDHQVSRAPAPTDALACPGCGAGLAQPSTDLECTGCGREFPIIAEIPDLRLDYPDPYLTLEEDRERARELEAQYEQLSFLELLREHWRRSGKPPELADRFVAGDMAAVGRSSAYLAGVEGQRGAPLNQSDSVLEVGCGTAGLAMAAAGRAGRVVATDISMRWLVLARKRLAEADREGVELLCCSAEAPPFPAGSFNLVIAGDVIEHAARPEEFVAGCRRVLRPGGVLFLATPNRYSLGLEPHVRLWGVGFLPRRLAGRYVAAVRHAPYDHVRLLSARALRRLLGSQGFEVDIQPPEIPAATVRTYKGLERHLVSAYNKVRRVRVVRRLLLAIGPFFHVFAKRES